MIYHSCGIGNRIATWQPAEQTGGETWYSVTVYEYDSECNKVLEKRGLEKVRQGEYAANCHELAFAYDGLNRLVSVSDQTGAKAAYNYDCLGQKTGERFRISPDMERIVRYRYDPEGRVTEITGPDQSVLKRFTYDYSGNLKTILEGGQVYTEYDYDLAGNPVAVYAGREKAAKKAAAQRLTYDARGNITGVEDGNHNRTEFVLDAWGRITEIHTPEGGVERYTYDYAGNITGAEDANGGIVTYRYNSLGQVYEITDQEGNTESFYCDKEGRRETHIDRNGNVERTLYNMDNRLSYQRAEDKKGRNPVVNQYLYYPDGSLKEASGGGITYRYEYTENGLLKSKKSSGEILLAYGYDKNRSLSSLTDVTGKTVRYVYDAMDRLKRVEDGTQGTTLAGYEYTDSGKVRALEYGNGVRSEYRYGDDGMPSGLVTVTPTGEVVLNYDYAYDGNGNCTKKSGERFQNEYTYDRMNRLAGAVYNGEWEKYTYDRAGNRLGKETEKGKEFYAYNAKNQLTRLEKGGKATDYRYDAQGNLLEERGDGNKVYEYDALNRLGGIRSGAGVWKNRYDGESLRYETEENDKVTRFVFDRGELASEESGDGGIRYIHGDDRVLCSERENMGMGYHIRDEAGSTLFILDRERNIRKSYRYDAFGRVLEERGDIENRLTYTGQMYDGGTGQYYLRARFYNPVTGRFLQEDVYRGDGLNLYAYCANNPVKYYDPSGYMSLCPGGKTFPGNSNGGSGIPESSRKLNSKGVPYPEAIDPRTGKNIPMPEGELNVVSKDQRVEWNNITRSEYIKEWYDRGFQTPPGGWKEYDIHHILPREYGGTNVFENLVPIERAFHQTQFNPWWMGY